MTINMVCSECGSALKVKDELAGSVRHCPKCKVELHIPAAHDDSPSSDMELETLASDLNGEDHSKNLVNAVAATTDHETAELLASEDTGELPASTATHENGPRADDEPETRPKPPPRHARTSAPPPRDDDEDFDPVAFLSESDQSEAPRTSEAPRSNPDPPPRVSPPREHAPREEPRPREQAKRSTPRPDVDETPRHPDRSDSPARSVTVSGASAAADLWDHAKAVKQLRKAMKEGSAEIKQHDDREPAVDWAGMMREIGLRGVGILAVGLAVAFGGYYVLDSMMGGGLKLPKLGYVDGVVSLDGQPVVGATVYYSPLESELGAGGSERIRTSTAITDKNGRYRMLYIDRTAGVAVGRSRVWVSSIGAPTPVNIPPDFGDGSMVLKDVKEGRQTIDLDMKSKPAQTAARR